MPQFLPDCKYILNTCWKHCALIKNNVHLKPLPDEGKFYLNGPIRAFCSLPIACHVTNPKRRYTCID